MEKEDFNEEFQQLNIILARAKQQLIRIEQDNAVLKETRENMKAELLRVESKIKENEILNKYLMEDHNSQESLLDKILDQIKVLRELKIEDKIKNERVKNSIIEFLNEEKKNKSDNIQQIEELEEFLSKVKNQIQLLKTPNLENLIKTKINLEMMTKHNSDLEKFEKLQKDIKELNESKKQTPNMHNMRRSTNYNSTGNFIISDSVFKVLK